MDKVNEICKVIEQYFATNKNISLVPAKDLMPYFINAGIFPKDYRNGLPIRNVLRRFDEANELYRIPHVIAERKNKNTNWFFSCQIKSGNQRALRPKISKPGKAKTNSSRKYSDEHYVVDLCDEVLSMKGSRQHRFSFLLGDGGTKLPVDVYYHPLNLVIEFNEIQHTKPVKHFDKPNKLTVSGVHRGEQRKIYDQRKRKLLPENGITVADISYSSFGCDSKGKIIRNREVDIGLIKSLLNPYIF